MPDAAPANTSPQPTCQSHPQNANDRQLEADFRRKIQRIEFEELELRERLQNEVEQVETTRRELERKLAEKAHWEQAARRATTSAIDINEYRRRNAEVVDEVVLE